MKPSDTLPQTLSNPVYEAWDYVNCEVTMSYRYGESADSIATRFKLPKSIVKAILLEANYITQDEEPK